ncbi:helix-turn-helix transcriptional regulator [Petroclostridium sp. X23]|uniref:helix-turn-helix domain-containing protein n=1 Tax=Petroclostridium sp. X23 TaxID=3045146 RepID=UPI0024ADE034|nr:helix-turn-helix transcriptional regulator [Petroclostridium sp. X23]WHH58144.1 helix-turn-helix transcriptional regulator [Petroclostridium sp. X23]
MTFGKRLRQLREQMNISQIELAKELKITSQAVSQYELDKRMPDAIMIIRLANFFNVSADYLLCRNNIQQDYVKENTNDFHFNPPEKLSVKGLPEEDISKIEEYISLLKQKHALRKTPPSK